VKRGAPLSLHVEYFIESLRAEMRAVEPSRGKGRAAPPRARKR
jgi:hypothetical protein